jgi:uncharacterized repeat protein (TIGR03803 family)
VYSIEAGSMGRSEFVRKMCQQMKSSRDIAAGIKQTWLRWLFRAALILGLAATPARAQSPEILAPPQPQTVPASFTASFAVAGAFVNGYQWYFDNEMITGATNAILNVTNAQQTNVGSYTVVLTNATASVTSSPVTLSVTNIPFLVPSMQFATLASLGYAMDGAAPEVGVIQGSDGYLYGSTSTGGTNNAASSTNGTVFKMSTNGALIWVFAFNNTNGYDPVGGVVQAGDGNLYGTTAFAGTNFGTVFRMTTNGIMSSLYVFQGLPADGGKPQAAPCVGTDGYLYGTTTAGGTNSHGTIYKMSTNGGAPVWSYSLSSNNGYVPLAGLVQGADGGLYGTTSQGGANNAGTLFRISSNGVFSDLYSFTNVADGAVPEAGLAQGTDGQLYGTTSAGGNTNLGGGTGYGTVFKITTNGQFTLLATFDGTNGGAPAAGLVQAGDGNFYGTTVGGGVEFPLGFGANFQLGVGYPYGYGTIFQVTPAGKLITLFSFDGNYDGNAPHSTLWQGRDGGLYGTTSQGGSNGLSIAGLAFGDGAVFRLGVIPPTIASAAVSGQTFSFTWNAMPGAPYQAQYKDALNTAQWLNLGGAITGTNGLAGQSDAIAATNRARFYRVSLQF